MSNRQKKTETFIIKVMDQQNATWQGSVTWVDEQREQYFRSTLELLKLIDGALEKRNDDEENSEQPLPMKMLDFSPLRVRQQRWSE